MKKFTLLLSALLIVSLSVLAQIKMIVHLNDADSVEFYASSVDSITFANFSIDSEIPDDAYKPTPILPNANGYEYVDLGLPSGTLWATMNVGATSPEDYGGYFAWGETQPKEEYNWSTYKWCEGSSYYTQTKYCTDSEDGTVDNKTILELSDDAANASWGGDWRMPTKEDHDELRTECTWTWEQKNGVNGYTVIGPNGNSIFLPAAGYRIDSDLDDAGSVGGYWSCSLDTDDWGSPCNLGFNSDIVYGNGIYRYYGKSVRPVLRVGFTYDAIFDSNGGEGTMPSITIDHANQLSVSVNKFTRPGYEFICWNTKADCTGVNYEQGDIFSVASDITLYAQWYKKETNITHEYVDLGLSVKWATCNVGATKPEETGYFFAWGETRPKAKYDWSTYKWCGGSFDTQTKYCTDSNHGRVDDKTILELSDDAANVNWGGSWRMPTKAEQDELRTECTWTWTTQNGVNGYKITSNTNGNSIFLPTAGSNGSYWSSSLDTNYSNIAYYLYFSSDNVSSSYCDRDFGLSVRPVLRVGFTYDAIFDSNGGEGTMPSIAIDHVKQLSVPVNKFTRPGYEFICWNTKADGTGVNYEEGDVFSVASDITLYAQWYKKETNITHEYVDLGLPSGTKWATCNVGADSPEEYGDYFAWGETRPKVKYDWSTYKWCEGSLYTQTKYCTDSDDGTVDNKTILELSDDAANVNWGGSWRMPTKAEQDELRTECTWTWTTQNGVKGYKVTSKTNGNSIFLPAAGCRSDSDLLNAGSDGSYWGSSLNTDGSNVAYYLGFYSYFVVWNCGYRDCGLSVRPVLP